MPQKLPQREAAQSATARWAQHPLLEALCPEVAAAKLVPPRDLRGAVHELWAAVPLALFDLSPAHLHQRGSSNKFWPDKRGSCSKPGAFQRAWPVCVGG
jgi:hypothetical protein